MTSNELKAMNAMFDALENPPKRCPICNRVERFCNCNHPDDCQCEACEAEAIEQAREDRATYCDEVRPRNV